MKYSKLIWVSIILSFFISSVYSKDKNEIKPKYIFYFIGDGMGLVQAQVSNDYLQATHGRDTGFCFYTFPYRTIMTTHADNRYVTGSAASGTALASGHKTSINTIGKSSDHTCDLVAIPNVGKETGFKTGILSSVFINHATPASFYAHNIHRSNYYEIALDLATSNIDFFAGGGFTNPKGANKDKPDAYEIARNAGYYIPSSYELFLKADNTKKMLFSTDVALHTDILTYRIDRPDNYPSLADLTGKAIEYLFNDKGFIIMVEGGAIDWAGHANDANTLVQESIDFELAVRKAFEFYQKYPEQTLIVVTADHETGGMTLGSVKTPYECNFPLLDNQKHSLGKLSDTLKQVVGKGGDFDACLGAVSAYTGLGDRVKLSTDEMSELESAYSKTLDYLQNNSSEKELYSSMNPLAVTAIKMLAAKAGIGWTTFGHTGVQVPVYAIGAGAEQFVTVHDNTDIANILSKLIRNKPMDTSGCK